MAVSTADWPRVYAIDTAIVAPNRCLSRHCATRSGGESASKGADRGGRLATGAVYHVRTYVRTRVRERLYIRTRVRTYNNVMSQLSDRKRAHMCTENHVCFGRIHATAAS